MRDLGGFTGAGYDKGRGRIAQASWLSHLAIVLPGLTGWAGSVLVACALVTKDLPAGTSGLSSASVLTLPTSAI